MNTLPTFDLDRAIKRLAKSRVQRQQVALAMEYLRIADREAEYGKSEIARAYIEKAEGLLGDAESFIKEMLPQG